MEIKLYILNLIIRELESRLANAEHGKTDSNEESKYHKGAMASRYDTFKEEAQYLSSAYQVQVAELSRGLNLLRTVRDNPPAKITRGMSLAIIEAEDTDTGLVTKYLILPAGGGNAYRFGEEEIIALNVDTPLGQAFLGVRAEDEVEVNVQGTTRFFNVITVT